MSREVGAVLKGNIVDAMDDELKKQVETEINGMTFTKNFRSPSAEEWYIFCFVK